MARSARTEPSLSEWAVLGLLSEGPAHGWEIARAFAPDGPIGAVWTVTRPLVYRAIAVLRELGYVEERGTAPSSTGPERTVLAPTRRGRAAYRGWLGRPVAHVRDLRSELLLKLLLLDRAGAETFMLLRAQLADLERGERALVQRVADAGGFDRTVATWRLTTARAARAFVEAVLDERAEEPVQYHAIGVVSSSHAALDGMPLQPAADTTGPSRIVLSEPHRGGLVDLDGFSHVWVIAHLHESAGWAPLVDPFLDDRPRGIFATRSPHRPNPISISLCRIVDVDGEGVFVAGLDLLDGTPVLDLKPYVPLFDAPAGDVASGWFEERAELIFERTSDERFEQRSRRHQ